VENEVGVMAHQFVSFLANAGFPAFTQLDIFRLDLQFHGQPPSCGDNRTSGCPVPVPAVQETRFYRLLFIIGLAEKLSSAEQKISQIAMMPVCSGNFLTPAAAEHPFSSLFFEPFNHRRP
jgi:hypothetical protein